MHTIVSAAYHPLVLWGINHAIKENHRSSKIVGQTDSIKGLVFLLRKHKPDAAIIDVAITWNSGKDLIEEIKNIDPSIELHLVCVHPLDRNVLIHLENKARKVLKAKVWEYISKDDLTTFPFSETDRA